MSFPKVAVVILNWNGQKYLQQFLPSVLASTYNDIEIVVADNGSTDDSILILKKEFPTVSILEFSVNEGYAKGYNNALKLVKADYYILLNSDVEVTTNWIEPIIDLMQSDRSIAVCQPKLRAYHARDQFEYAGAAGGWLDSYGYPFAKGRVFDICEADHAQYDTIAPVFWASGAAMFIRSEVFHLMNGFDEYFFAHQEEIDLCWRIQLAGYKIYSCPQSVVYHVGGGTLPKGNSRKTYLNFRNNKIMLSKNLPWNKKIWVMPVRDMLDAVSAWKGLLHGDGGYFLAILRAHLGFLRWRLLRKGNDRWKPVNKTNSMHGLYKGNIAWQHFVGKKNTFSEIVK